MSTNTPQFDFDDADWEVAKRLIAGIQGTMGTTAHIGRVLARTTLQLPPQERADERLKFIEEVIRGADKFETNELGRVLYTGWMVWNFEKNWLQPGPDDN
jgi:hypothetical protein